MQMVSAAEIAMEIAADTNLLTAEMEEILSTQIEERPEIALAIETADEILTTTTQSETVAREITPATIRAVEIIHTHHRVHQARAPEIVALPEAIRLAEAILQQVAAADAWAAVAVEVAAVAEVEDKTR